MFLLKVCLGKNFCIQYAQRHAFTPHSVTFNLFRYPTALHFSSTLTKQTIVQNPSSPGPAALKQLFTVVALLPLPLPLRPLLYHYAYPTNTTLTLLETQRRVPHSFNTTTTITSSPAPRSILLQQRDPLLSTRLKLRQALRDPFLSATTSTSTTPTPTLPLTQLDPLTTIQAQGQDLKRGPPARAQVAASLSGPGSAPVPKKRTTPRRRLDHRQFPRPHSSSIPSIECESKRPNCDRRCA